MVCKPKVIFLDLDGTIWDTLDVSSYRPPFRPVNDDDVIVDSLGREVRLYEGVREFLSTVRKAGILVYVLSWNVYEIAYDALRTFNLTKYFDGLYIEPHPEKDVMMSKALRHLRDLGINVKPCEIVYVDDRDIHIDQIRRAIGDVYFIRMWVDVKSFKELTNLILDMLNKGSRHE